jgi:predicted nucleic acid-binding protein
VFLDANVLFSAAWSAQSGLLRIWSLSLTRVTSPYAIAEAERNLAHKRRDALDRLSTLVGSLEITDAVASVEDGRLPPKDVPILAAAVGARCQILVTGDVADFGRLIGHEVHGIRVLTPSMLLAELGR